MKNSKTINKSDVTFEVKWKFTPNKNEVIHKFVSKDPNKELLKEVTDLLPTNQTGKVKGDKVAPTEPTTKKVNVSEVFEISIDNLIKGDLEKMKNEINLE